jgi:hypothetical protein
LKSSLTGTEARQIGCHHPPASRQLGRDQRPDAAVGRDPVQHHERIAVAELIQSQQRGHQRIV